MQPAPLSPVRGSNGYSVPLTPSATQQIAGASKGRRSITFSLYLTGAGAGSTVNALLSNSTITSLTDGKPCLAISTASGPITIEGPIAQQAWHALSGSAATVCVIEDQGEAGYGGN